MKKVIFVCDLCGWQMAEPYVMIQVEDREAEAVGLLDDLGFEAK